MISSEHWQAWCLPHSPGSWGFCWTGLFPKHFWFCLKTKINKPKNPPCCSVRATCPETWQEDWWEWLLPISPCSHGNMFIYRHLWVSIDTDHFSVPWCQKVTFWSVPWGLREAEMVLFLSWLLSLSWLHVLGLACQGQIPQHVSLKGGFTNQCQSESKILLRYQRKSQVILASPEPFSAADQLLSSAEQASGQERQGAHHKFTFRVRKKPFPMTVLCSKAKRMRKQSITRHHRKIHIFLLLWFLIWGVEGCFVLVGSFGFIWFVFRGFFLLFLRQFFIRM